MEEGKARSVAVRQLARVRRICAALPGTSERLSNGEPTFFVHQRVYVMFANDHHGDGHIAVWVPTAPGMRDELIAGAPATYFHPPYVGVRGWVGIELPRVTDEALAFHIQSAWEMIAPKRVLAEAAAPPPAALSPRRRGPKIRAPRKSATRRRVSR